jgi:hypothetical protein
VSCGSGSCVVHSDGVGQNFNNCTAFGTYNAALGLAACTAYAISMGMSAAECSDGWTCPGDTDADVCFSDPTGMTCISYCWGYAGTEKGFIYSCACPDAKTGQTWE